MISLERHRPQWEDSPYSLVSLDEMYQFWGAYFTDTARRLTALEHHLKEIKEDYGCVSDAHREIFLPLLAEIETECKRAGLTFSLVHIEWSLTRLNDKECLVKELKQFLPGIRDRIQEELHLNIYLRIESHHKEFYEGEMLFGEKVAQNFSSSSYDICEAGKCLALNRSTASVFHLMRIMENGLQALGKSLNDPNLNPKKNPSWDAMLKKCLVELQKPLADRCTEWKSDDVFFSQATGNLLAVKNAWRNPTMHIGEKYTDEEASDIFLAVRGFMRHLATKLSE